MSFMPWWRWNAKIVVICNPQTTDEDHQFECVVEIMWVLRHDWKTSIDESIVIMLSRLEMNVHECINAYVALFDQMFRKKQHRLRINEHVQKKFDIEKLKRSIREILKRKNIVDENALLKRSENQQCKMLML